jgi:CARDB
MKKQTIGAIVLIALLLVLGGLYWLGYLTFQGYIPTFTPNPGMTPPNTPAQNQETPRLTIENIRGRINKISADIKNIGNQNAQSINWSIAVTGGILKRIDLRSTGTISTLSTQSKTTVITDRIPLGIGRLEITVTVDVPGGEPVTQTARGFKFLFFVFGVRS